MRILVEPMPFVKIQFLDIPVSVLQGLVQILVRLLLVIRYSILFHMICFIILFYIIYLFFHNDSDVFYL